MIDPVSVTTETEGRHNRALDLPGQILAIVALVLASNADKKIKASGHVLPGDGMVVAAKVIAWANIILLVGGFALVLLIGGIAASTN